MGQNKSACLSTNDGDTLPLDDLVDVEIAFNMIGVHRFGYDWRGDITRLVRLGSLGKKRDRSAMMGRWALKALLQCVQNGWLPLFYFIGERPTRRIEFYRNPDGLALHALYPKPLDNEAGGQIELDGGAIYPCMVDIGGLPALLTRKFGAKTARRGPARRFTEFDEALDLYFLSHPIKTPHKDIISALGVIFKGEWPGSTVRHARINEAIDRALKRARTVKTPDGPPDGQR